MRSSTQVTSAVFLGAVVSLLAAVNALAQGSSAKATARNKPVSTRALDAKASQLFDGFVKDSLTVALEYEQAGEPQKAKELLETVLTLHPDAQAIKDKIKTLDEKMLSSNELRVEIDPEKGWGSPVAQVAKGQKIRIHASGSYRLVVTATLGPEGFPSDDPLKGDMAGNVTCGALMGIVVAKDKPGRPFRIESGREYTPEQDGLLFLRLNTPPASKCTGRITAMLSGQLGKVQQAETGR